MATVEVKVPDIGDFKDVAIIEVLVKPGDHVKKEQSLITVESDKASMEIPSEMAGTVKALKVKVGDKVNEGSVILTLDTQQAAGKVAQPETQVPPVASTSASQVGREGCAAEVKVPDIGDFKDVTVIEVLVQSGDEVKLDQGLITVESDKASMEIPSSVAGKLEALKVKVGDKINAGDVIALVESAVLAVAVAAPAQHESMVQATAATSRAVAPAEVHEPAGVASKLDRLPHASPSIRKMARELGVPLKEVKGSGHKGRITLVDLQNFIASVMRGETRTQAQAAHGASSGVGLDLLPWPEVDFSKFGEVERKPLSRIKKISGANLHRNWVMIPHVTNCENADITELEAFRVQLNKEAEKSKSGIKYTLLAFLIKACVAALQKFPEFNASLQGEVLVYKKYFNVGFAADTPNGLVVPVIKNADRKGLADIARETAELAAKARAGKLSPSDMSGGCFSISSLGGFGGTYFTPIINAPEVAILGVCRSSMQPVWDGTAFQPRLIVPLSLSYDHRVIDGALAARFNAYLSAVLADFRRVLL